MKKRGQITIFVILGIIVLIVIGLLFYFKGNLFKKELNDEEAQRFVSARVEPVKNVVVNCVGQKLMEGVRFVSWQGGYFDPVDYENICVDYDLDSAKCLNNLSISYACKDSVNRLPLLSFISREINQFMSDEAEKEELEKCVKDSFDDFEREGLELDYDFKNLFLYDPYIMRERIRQDIKFPVKISRSGYSTNIKDLSFVLESSLFDIYMIVADVVNDECGGGVFEIDDYVWEHEQGGDILAASISNGPNEEGYKPWYLLGYNEEEDGTPLKFHFLIEE